ncbi:hypothetical protein EZS27_019387 [termite gut metagenome]|uniref:Uncharacterized protein n=1 Tax=termite gut metagenome TaxID=433724 RepID=A0A5J4REH3_9ZZZZ
MFRNLLYSVVIVLSLFSCKDDDPIVGEVVPPPAEIEDFSRIKAFLAQDWTIESFFSKTEYIPIRWIDGINYVIYKYTITNKQSVSSNSIDQNIMVLHTDPVSSNTGVGILERYVWVTQELVDLSHINKNAEDYNEMMNYFINQRKDKKIFRIRELLKIEGDLRKNQVFLKTERTTIESYTTYLFWKENNDMDLSKVTNGLICVKLPNDIGNTETPVTEFKSDDLLFKVKTN